MSAVWNMKIARADQILMNKFLSLLNIAAGQLANLAQPALVAACPHKFDDMGRNPDWLGVQVGRAYWERTDYGAEFGKGADILEKARNPEDLPVARSVLSELQKEGWRRITEELFQVRLYSEALGVVVQDGVKWFVISASEGGIDAAFILQNDGTLRHIGRTERLDQALGRDRPLLIEEITPEALPHLHSVAPQFPLGSPVIDNEEREVFTRLVKQAFETMNGLPDVQKYLASSYRFGNQRTLSLSGDDFQIDVPPGNKYKNMQEVEKRGATAVAMFPILENLEKEKWQSLFKKFVPSSSYYLSLGLLVRESENWLIVGETSVFAFDASKNNLEFVGICDRIRSPYSLKTAIIRLFDGRAFLPLLNISPPPLSKAKGNLATEHKPQPTPIPPPTPPSMGWLEKLVLSLKNCGK